MRPSDSDLAHCHALLAKGSRSFSFAGRLLPARMRDPVAALYAFCRVSDDLVDESDAPLEACRVLTARLDDVYRGKPANDPVDRALVWLADEHALPRAPLDALLEGYAWDAEARRFATLSGTFAYASRVAASVGVAMTWLMGVHDHDVLARAADLGVAMQLTNIARDVGDDARLGRIYLPLEWLKAIDVDAWIADPHPNQAIRHATARLLDEADVLYERADAGIPSLPSDVRAAIRAASKIYREIGSVIVTRGFDSVSARAVTTTRTKTRLALASFGDELRARIRNQEVALHAAPLPEVVHLLPAR